ncbi:THUMP-like domain-containing protein [Aquimarina rhabdastrellae]
MNTAIFDTAVQDFIIEHSEKKTDLSKLILAGSPFKNISIQELAQQIQSRIKAKHKLPTWYQKKNIYYPPTLNLEQTSSEVTAAYKSSLISGEHLIDLTGGFGIDDYYFSKSFNTVIHCELNTDLSSIVKQNLAPLEIFNITTVSGDSLETLQQQKTVDWIFIDPSRRHEAKGKVFFLEDCLPNVPANLEVYYSHSKNIMIKTSPLLDLDAGIKSLNGVKEIHCIAVKNEVKELLWILEKEYEGNTLIKTVNLISDTKKEEFSFTRNDATQNTQITYTLPQQYLYEPNAAILKSGGFLNVAKQLGIPKLHPHSHLYTSHELSSFPGRTFIIESYLPYQKSALKKLNITKANITTRNFPESVAQLRKKFKIKDGGSLYIFFTTDYQNNKIVIICNKSTQI